MGGCVVPPGTAAMCQTGGEEERGNERAEEREKAMGGREGRVERGRVREEAVEGREIWRKKKGGKKERDAAWVSFSCQSR